MSAMETNPQKPDKTDLKQAVILALAGMALGMILNAVHPKGISLSVAFKSLFGG